MNTTENARRDDWGVQTGREKSGFRKAAFFPTAHFNTGGGRGQVERRRFYGKS